MRAGLFALLSFLLAGSTARAGDRHQKIVWNEIAGVDEPQDGKNHCGDHRGPAELTPHAVHDRRARIGSRHDFTAFLLVANAPRQHGEQRYPPDQEVDGDGRAFAHSCSSSTKVPQKSFGCRNSTGLPWAPIFGSPSPSTRAPCALSVSRAARMSGTS